MAHVRLTKKGKAFLVIFFLYIVPMILLVIGGVHATNTIGGG